MGWLDRLESDVKALSVGHLDDNFIPADAAHSRRRGNVGEGLDSNVVMSPVNWILRNFTESNLVMERKRDEVWKAMDHDLVDLLHRPNEFYGGGLLWKATLISFFLDGNAYWLKVRNQVGGVMRLWYLPHFLVKPKWPGDGSEFITHYEYRPDAHGEPVDIPNRNIVHFRYGGLDPENVRLGKSPVKPILREVFTDQEASSFSANILRNMGVPGGVIAPSDADRPPSQEDIQEMKDRMKNGFTGDKRGDWLVLGTPTKVSQFGFDPNTLQLTGLRDIAEERVCAALGVPAAVVGFGAGLQQTKVGATMRELRRMAWATCIEPTQSDLAEQLNFQLLGDFMSQMRRFRLRFDSSDVPAFGEEETERTERVTLMVEKGVLRVDRAQEMLGIEVDDGQDVYLRPAGTVAVPADGSEPRVIGGPGLNGNGANGDGGGDGTLNRAARLLERLEDEEEQ